MPLLDAVQTAAVAHPASTWLLVRSYELVLNAMHGGKPRGDYFKVGTGATYTGGVTCQSQPRGPFPRRWRLL